MIIGNVIALYFAPVLFCLVPLILRRKGLLQMTIPFIFFIFQHTAYGTFMPFSSGNALNSKIIEEILQPGTP